MAATQLGIIYSTALKTIRRVVAPDNDTQLNSPSLLLTGESIYKMPLSSFNVSTGLSGLQAILAAQVGAAGNDLCAICNGQNQVVGVVRADTSIPDDSKGLPRGYYMVQSIPAQVQTGTFVNDLGVTQPILQAITAGWFYNPTNGHFGLTKNP